MDRNDRHHFPVQRITIRVSILLQVHVNKILTVFLFQTIAFFVLDTYSYRER